MMKKSFQRACSLSLAVLMALLLLPCAALPAAADAAAFAVGDIITFGSYPQTKVTDAGLITELNAQTLGTDDTVTYGGSRYKRVYFEEYIGYYGGTTTDPNKTYQDDNDYFINTVYWFKFEPVEWRVLALDNSELFLMAEKGLVAHAYNDISESVTWETCSMRPWLNTAFYQEIFNPQEQAMIQTSAVVNEDGPFGSSGGNDTADKLFLLSYSEVTNSAYGFNSDRAVEDPARIASPTDYACCSGLSAQIGQHTQWLLRTPGSLQSSILQVRGNGDIINEHWMVRDTYHAVRPALRMVLPVSVNSVMITIDGSDIGLSHTVKVPLFTMFKNCPVQLGYVTDADPSLRVEFTSDNERVTVDSTGLVTNLGNSGREANITVTVYDADDNALVSDSVMISFYKFKWEMLFNWLMQLLGIIT